MARLWSCGFELNSLTNNVEVGTVMGAPTISTTTVRSGTYAMRISSLSSGVAMGFRLNFATAAGNGPYFFRVYLRIATLPSAEMTIIQLNDTDATTTPVVRITLDNSGLLALFDEDGQIGSDSSALSTNTWYRIEIEVDRTPAAGSQVVRARIDGTEFAGSATRDLSAGFLTYNVGGNLNSEAQTVGDWFYDDLAVNDNTGSFQTTYPGEGEIIHLRPNAAGDNNAWTRGGTDSGANWSQTSEVTPNDATDYVESNTSGQIDDYNLDATPAALESTDTINVVQVGCRAAVSDATGADPDFVLRIKDSSGGTVEESTSLDVNSVTWASPVPLPNTPARLSKLTLYDLPGASTTAWTKATLDTAQIGIRESVADAHFARVSTIWLLVDHKPGPTHPKTLSLLGVG